MSAEMIDCELFYAVTGMSALDEAQNEIFDRLYRAAVATGAIFAPRMAGSKTALEAESKEVATPERLLAGLSIFSTLTSEEKQSLAAQMQRKDFKLGDVIADAGTVLQSLYIVSEGVLVGSRNENGKDIEVIRLARGEFFGEGGLLTGEPLTGKLTALTRVSLFEISKDVFSPVLQARPSLAEELSETLSRRRLARQSVLNTHEGSGERERGSTNAVAAGIRRLFALH